MNTKNAFLWLALLTAVTVSACSDNKDAQDAKPETALEHAAKHLDPKYVCPMHSQIVRDKPGKCCLMLFPVMSVGWAPG